MFQHSQQPASPRSNYHADLLRVPLVLFRVLVSFLSLQPRHRPTPDARAHAHAHAQAAASSFPSRHLVITLLLQSALLSPHSALVPVFRAHASSSPSAAALMCAAPRTPPAARRYLRSCTPTRSHTSRSVRTPLCTPPALPHRIYVDHDLCPTPYTTRSSCQSLLRAPAARALSLMLSFPFTTLIPCSTHLHHPIQVYSGSMAIRSCSYILQARCPCILGAVFSFSGTPVSCFLDSASSAPLHLFS
ncbi:hypothetical protein B0H13DRAFT_2317776 [Mycena leptocephala]|nr:hypothetical protein B0H13DRAFT_2317776 [Mycena leptocephala]